MTDDNRHYDASETGGERITPPCIPRTLGATLCGFDLDPASGAEPSPGYAKYRITALDDPDGLNARWGEYAGDVWLNFPYGRGLNEKWADKVTEVLDRGEIDTLTVLLPGSTSTNWYRDAYAKARYKTEIHQKLTFETPDYVDEEDENNATFASIIHSFGEFPAEYRRALHELGGEEFETTVWERRGRWG